MSRFYIPGKNIDTRKKEIVASGDEAHHITDVMRLKESERVRVFDGEGNEYLGLIERIDKYSKEVYIIIEETLEVSSEKNLEIILAQAITKKNKMDYIIEKATELGVNKVIPLITDRTIVRPDEKGARKKHDRWVKIAVEAAKQCGRSVIPEVENIKKYKDVIGGMDDYSLAIMAHLEDETIPIKEVIKGFKKGKIIIFIGPEGDFTSDEILQAKANGCKFVSLGDRVLKSDTAGLYALSVISYEAGV